MPPCHAHCDPRAHVLLFQRELERKLACNVVRLGRRDDALPVVKAEVPGVHVEQRRRRREHGVLARARAKVRVRVRVGVRVRARVRVRVRVRVSSHPNRNQVTPCARRSSA